MEDSTRRLHHTTPVWVKPGANFHIRIRTQGTDLTQPALARELLCSAAEYHRRQTWHSHLFLLMPDHLHAILAFPPERDMSVLIGKWKAWQTRSAAVKWQENYFDHRIRSDHEFHLKSAYIRNNPVVMALCSKPEDWPWVIDAATIGSG
jgi:REP element-mobilizing transposase RayT